MARVRVDRAKIAAFCKRNHVRRLGLFGSVLRSDFGPESDVDVLVDFDPGEAPGFMGLAAMERELAQILGHHVDLRTPEDLSPLFRDEVIAGVEVQYVE